MKIAVLSGKGGTGKTTLSVNLFSRMKKGTLIDTDTEEPNAHIFLNGEHLDLIDVYKEYPVIDEAKCDLCGICSDNCNFNAIITGNNIVVFNDLCHDCGMCQMVCPSDAITYKKKSIGEINRNAIGDKNYNYGKLSVGEVSGVKIINQLMKSTDNNIIVDCPPGVSCSTVAALKNVDYAIVCAEPTPFGLSDMKMVVELLRAENLDFGVVVNKSGLGDDSVYNYLEEEQITLLANIPFTKERAVLYSEGKIISDYDSEFSSIIDSVLNLAFGGEVDA